MKVKVYVQVTRYPIFLAETQGADAEDFENPRPVIGCGPVIKRVLSAFLALTAAGTLAIYLTGWFLSAPVPAKIGPPPSDLGAQSVQFPSESGAKVHGWWCPMPGARGSILLLPGVRANRESMIERARFLRGAGFSVLLIDFQATGETPGDHITFGWLESRDVLGAITFLRTAAPGEKIGVIGSSLGGAAALLATPPLRVDALVLESVYPTIERATANRLRKYLGPGGELLAPVLMAQMRFRIGVSPARLRPVDRIASVSCPILIINGEKDRNTTREDAALLLSRAGSPKSLWLIPKAGHVDLHRAAKTEYEARVGAFFSEVMRLK